MPFKKGQSGNPAGGGRKKKTDLELDALCKLHKLTPMAVDVLEEAMTSGTKESLPAAIHVLDRVWGKPKQQVDTNLSGGINVTVTIKEKKPE